MVVVDVYIRMMGEGKVDGEHANKFEGGLIALRSDSLQIYTGGVYVFKGGELYMHGGGTVVVVVVVRLLMTDHDAPSIRAPKGRFLLV